jgi:hypothetical protein
VNWTHDTRRSPTARFRYDGHVVLTFPYSKRLVDQLKAQIPGHARTYDPATKEWTVAPAYAAIALSLLRTTFPDAVTEEPGHRTEPQPIRSSDQAYATLHLLPSAPDELIDAAFRVLARQCHPDVAGGDGSRMRELNDAYADLKAKARASA